MDLIVVESPNKVRDVERYARACGFDVQVQATCGHLLDLPPMSAGPAIDTTTFSLAKQRPRDEAAAARVQRIRGAIATAERVIVATDPDREGEAIGAEVWAWIPPGKAWRATFEEITPAGVERGLRAMRPSPAITAVEAAHARRVIDRLAGWHGTALVFDKLRHHRGLSAGRLQSAALRLVVERYREHGAFKPSTSYRLRVTLRTTTGHEVVASVADPHGNPRSFGTDAEARAVPMPASARVASVQAEKRQQRPRPPFEASSWLQVACKALGISVKEATEATQALFESGQHDVPANGYCAGRRGSDRMGSREIEQRFGRRTSRTRPWQHKDAARRRSRRARSDPADHPARPCRRARRRPIGQWGRAYALIEARFLASQAAARIVEDTVAQLTAGERFLARGQVELFDGWRRVLID